MRDTLVVVLGCMLMCSVLVVAGAYSQVPEWALMVLPPALSIALFRWVRRYVVHHGTAQLDDTCLKLGLGKAHKIIAFQDLTSFKSYDGKNGMVLYLNTAGDKFTLSANNNFCNTEAFESFCTDVMAQLERYKATHNRTLVHEGSVYATNGFLVFLVVATAVYLICFALEPPDIRPYIGTAGGVWLALMWWACLYKREAERRVRLEPTGEVVK